MQQSTHIVGPPFESRLSAALDLLLSTIQIWDMDSSCRHDETMQLQ